jgi:hypothetical protein
MKTQKAKNGITIPSMLNNNEVSELLTTMDENPIAVINHIKNLQQNLNIQEIEIKELQKEKKHLIESFEELLDYAIELRLKMGYDTDNESFKYEWFEKSNII